ncbi:COG4123 Predicted O-methyltransferase [Rhabdaerophilaceae bacterium]
MQRMDAPPPPYAPAVTDDRLFGGALRLFQPAKGHRAGTDGVLLAAATPVRATRIADLGASTGLVGLRAAQSNPQADVLLIERDPVMLALAERNIAANNLSGRVQMLEADCLAKPFADPWRASFDCVLTNPPYFEPGASRRSPHKGDAHVMTALDIGANALELWLRRSISLLKPKGRIIAIHRADALPALLACLSGRVGGLALKFVHPQVHQPAMRVLVSGTRGSRAPLTILEPLVLHEPDGSFAPLAQRINLGSDRLNLS